MDDLINLLERFIRIDPVKILQEVFVKANISDLIIEMNTEDQLFEEGIDSKGVELNLENPYAPFTIAYKRATGQPFDRVTLNDTGEFYDSWSVVMVNGSIFIEADTKKEDNDLAERYGVDIIGLTDENFNLVIQAIKKYYIIVLLDHILKR